MKEDIHSHVQRIAAGRFDDDGITCCQRGLEYRTCEGANRRRRNKARARTAVLEEQDSQWNQGVNEPEIIARIYSLASYHCQMAANEIALEDQKCR